MYVVRRRYGQTLENDIERAQSGMPAPIVPASTVGTIAAAAAGTALIIFLLPGAITIGLIGLGIYAIAKSRKKSRRRRRR